MRTDLIDIGYLHRLSNRSRILPLQRQSHTPLRALHIPLLRPNTLVKGRPSLHSRRWSRVRSRPFRRRKEEVQHCKGQSQRGRGLEPVEGRRGEYG